MPDEKKTIHCIRRMAAAVPVTLCSCGVLEGSQVWGGVVLLLVLPVGYLGDEFLIKRETGSRIENAVHS